MISSNFKLCHEFSGAFTNFHKSFTSSNFKFFHEFSQTKFHELIHKKFGKIIEDSLDIYDQKVLLVTIFVGPKECEMVSDFFQFQVFSIVYGSFHEFSRTIS